MVNRLAFIAFIGNLALLGTGCVREKRVDDEHCKCSNADKSAHVTTPPSAAVATAMASPSGAGPHLQFRGSTAYNLRFTDSCRDYDGISKPDQDIAELEREVSRGNACSAAKLAGNLLESLGRPEDYARALALSVAAQNVGIALPPKLCVLFELTNDRPGLAACYEVWRSDRYALMLAFGDGVPRDLARARRIANMNNYLIDTINSIDPNSPPTTVQYCNEDRANGSSRDMYDCATDRNFIRDYTASKERAAAFDKLVYESRIDVLRKAFLNYRDIDLNRRWHSFLGGSGGISGYCKESLKEELHEDFDDGLKRLAGLAPPRDASTPELEASARDLLRAEKDAGNSEFQALLGSLHGKETADEHLRLIEESSRRYRLYEDIAAKIAKDRQGIGAERGLRVYLRRERISALGQCPG